MPSSHNFVLDWNPEKFIQWAESIGQATKDVITHILSSKTYPEQSFRSCVGILSSANKVGKQRVNDACKRALEYEVYTYTVVKNILDKGLDKNNTQTNNEQYTIPLHENVRGREFYK
jgi:transposase